MNVGLYDENCDLREQLAALEEQFSKAGAAPGTTLSTESVLAASSTVMAADPNQDNLRETNLALSLQVTILTTQLKELKVAHQALLGAKNMAIDDLNDQLAQAKSVRIFSKFYTIIL